MNLSCANCHEDTLGQKRLLAETDQPGPSETGSRPTVSKWQSIGSLNRRLRACLFGIRATMLPADAPEYVALALFLAWRAEGLPVETPAVRR
jgi:sulfur-oxidizing protein SoxA